MFRVEYFCPRQSPFWQGQGSYATLPEAEYWAQIMKPPMGNSRVLDPSGRIVAMF